MILPDVTGATKAVIEMKGTIFCDFRGHLDTIYVVYILSAPQSTYYMENFSLLLIFLMANVMKWSTLEACSCHDDRFAFSFAYSATQSWFCCARMQYVLICFVTEIRLPMHLYKRLYVDESHILQSTCNFLQ